MEDKGAVNYYRCQRCRWSVHTINLNVGVTPFTIRCRGSQADDGRDHLVASNFYQLPARRLVCRLMFYRPTPSEFGQLDNSVQRHVLGGGLLLAELGASPVDSDPVEHDWTYKRFRQWAMDYYRLTPEAWEVLS